MNENKTNINWYPGHMAKTKREIKEILQTLDIVIELVDSRIPYSSHILDLNEFIKNKPIIIAFNKYDICDEKETEKWVEYYENAGYKVVKINAKEGNSYKQIIKASEEIMQKVNEKRKLNGLMPKKARCLIVGVPNVGKSTLINKLANKKVVDVANKPGVTKKLKSIKINEKLDLIDSPGILWPKLDNEEVAFNLASMSIIKEEVIPINEVAIYILEKLNKYYKEILKKEFDLDEFNVENIEDVYKIISKKRNILINPDDIDYEKISLIIINLIKSEKIKNITFDRL